MFAAVVVRKEPPNSLRGGSQFLRWSGQPPIVHICLPHDRILLTRKQACHAVIPSIIEFY